MAISFGLWGGSRFCSNVMWDRGQIGIMGKSLIILWNEKRTYNLTYFFRKIRFSFIAN